MHINETLKNFLCDKSYYITFYNDYLYAFNFIKIKKITNLNILLEFLEFSLVIKGTKLYVSKMSKNELIIKGNINTMEIIHE